MLRAKSKILIQLHTQNQYKKFKLKILMLMFVQLSLNISSGLWVEPVDLQSSVLQLCHGCPVPRPLIHTFVLLIYRKR